MNKPRNLYLIIWRYDNQVVLGYLPFRQAPKELIDALPNGDCECDRQGFTGKYYNRKLARIHLKAEKAWRKEDLTLVTIRPRS